MDRKKSTFLPPLKTNTERVVASNNINKAHKKSAQLVLPRGGASSPRHDNDYDDDGHRIAEAHNRSNPGSRFKYNAHPGRKSVFISLIHSPKLMRRSSRFSSPAEASTSSVSFNSPRFSLSNSKVVMSPRQHRQSTTVLHSHRTRARRLLRLLRNVIIAVAAFRSHSFNRIREQNDIAYFFEHLPRIYKHLNPNGTVSTKLKRVISRTSSDTSQAGNARKNNNKKGITRRAGDVPHLPVLAELRDLPNELRETFMRMARERLLLTILPQFRMKRRRRWRQVLLATEISTFPPMSIDTLKRQQLFNRWPDSIIHDIVARAIPVVFVKGEIVLYEGEPASGGMYFLVQGTVRVQKKKSKLQKSLSDHMSQVLIPKIEPQACLGEYALLTEEVRLATVKVTSPTCLMWVITKDSFDRGFSRVPRSIITAITADAFQKRNSSLSFRAPMTMISMRNHTLFRGMSDLMLSGLIEQLVPCCVPKSYTLFEATAAATHVYFLMSGRCGAHRDIAGQSVHITSWAAGSLLGSEAVLNGTVYGDTMLTLTNCDIWELSKDALDSALQMCGSTLMEQIMYDAQHQRRQALAVHRGQYRDYSFKIPLLHGFARKEAIRDVILLFQPRVYTPMSVMCCSTHMCDRVIILTSGHARIGSTSATFHIGESIGFSCILPHRWSMTVQAVTFCECLELPRGLFETLLKDLNLLTIAKEHVLRLLFPEAQRNQNAVAESRQTVLGHMRTPAVFPVSNSVAVHFSEEGFGAGNNNKQQLQTSKTVLSPAGTYSPQQQQLSAKSSVQSTPLPSVRTSTHELRRSSEPYCLPKHLEGYDKPAESLLNAGKHNKTKNRHHLHHHHGSKGMSKVSNGFMWVKRQALESVCTLPQIRAKK